MADWKRPREDLECEDLKSMPKPKPVYSRIPNHLFGDFLSLLEFFSSFQELMEVKDSFPNGITYDVLESALRPVDSPGGTLFDLLNFALNVIFDLQHQEDEEVKLEKLSLGTDISGLGENVLGKDEDLAGQIKSATKMARWSIKHQGGQALHDLHMNEYSITEILRLHLESSGAFRSDKSVFWCRSYKTPFLRH
jgi:bromodomain adjacent to zinc finger domain protein 1A